MVLQRRSFIPFVLSCVASYLNAPPFFNVFVEASKRKCPGHFGGKTGVANLCEAHFPDSSSEKIWFVKFYAPWCGHCNNMKPAWITIAKELAGDKDIGIGGVDCDQQDNKGLCGKYGVQGFPTIKAIINGKAKAYQGAREAPPMKEWILAQKEKRGSKGGSAKCQKGIFKSTVKDSVLPLCSKHYPDNKSKNPWVIALYNKNDFDKSDEFNRLALEFGNEPVDKNKSRKKEEKQSKRLEHIREKYSVKGVDGKRKAGKSKDALAKFGAVCCDCEKEQDPKCADKKLPHFSVFNSTKKKTFEYDQMEKFDIDHFTGFVLDKLEYMNVEKQAVPSSKKEEL